jgi:hypothetical protein
MAGTNGDRIGKMFGRLIGIRGRLVGLIVTGMGTDVGFDVGLSDGCPVGRDVTGIGTLVGIAVRGIGTTVGLLVGFFVGTFVGLPHPQLRLIFSASWNTSQTLMGVNGKRNAESKSPHRVVLFVTPNNSNIGERIVLFGFCTIFGLPHKSHDLNSWPNTKDCIVIIQRTNNKQSCCMFSDKIFRL